MRNRLIIVGNGLDLALGLKTSYEDFLVRNAIDFIIPTLNEADENWVSSNSNTLSGEFCSIRINSSKPYYREVFCEDLNFLNKAIPGTPTLLGLKQWFNKYGATITFFKMSLFQNLFDQSVVKGWCDIERSYFNTLYDHFQRGKNIDTLNDEFVMIKNKLRSYISRLDEESSKYSHCLTHFSHFIEDLCESSFSNQKLKLNQVNFLNFNYTGTVRRNLISARFTDKSKVSLINIHGTVEGDNEPIVFGYGDDVIDEYRKLENAGEDNLIEHFKSHYYSQNDNYLNLTAFIEEGPFEVLVVGHSCGLSDRTMLKTIFEHGNCLEIKIFHHKEPEEEAKKEHLFLDLAISRHFDDKIKKRERVTVFNRFQKIPQCDIEIPIN